MNEEPLTQGEILTLAIAQAAGKAGVPITKFARPLSPNLRQWIKQLRFARNPKPATVARIEALIAGQPVPPPPANNFQASPRKPATVIVRTNRDPIPTSAPVDRDPCFRCGVRGDIGCNCGGRQ